MADDYLSPLFAERMRNVSWKEWHPHRVLTQSTESISERISRLRSAFAKTKLGDSDYLADLAAKAVIEAIDRSECTVSTVMRDALIDLVAGLMTQNKQIIEFPEIEIRSWTADEAAHITSVLDELETRITHEDRIRDYFLSGVFQLATGYIAALNPTEDRSPFSVPLYTSTDPAGITARTIVTFAEDLHPEADSIRALAFSATRVQLLDNMLNVSRLTYEQYVKTPYKIVLPADCDLAPERLIDVYLTSAPLLPFLETPVPFVIPQATRFEHCHIIGGTGHGKTQLLQNLVLSDLDDPDRPSVVVIDSQGDMVRKLSRLDRFANSDRLIIVDPSDTQFPLALNVFDIHKERLESLTLGQREQMLAGIIELYDYIFGAIGADLTQKQSVVFRYITRLMLDIPNATIQTLRNLMEDERPFRPYIERLTGTTRAFFENEFSDKSFTATKQQIRRRLYGVLSNPTFERIFSSERNKLNMSAALNGGKVVVINTAKDVLKSEASSFFGRYMIALVLQAAFERAAMPENRRRPAFLYIDEAADYFDDNIDALLNQARKFKLSVTLAHQFLDQLSPSLRASVMTNPTIRFAGGVSHRDANALDADMRTTSDFLMGMRKGAATTEFACYVRNVTLAAMKLTVPLGAVEREPAMSDKNFANVLDRSRALVAEALAPSASPKMTLAPEPSVAPPNPIDPSTPSKW